MESEQVDKKLAWLDEQQRKASDLAGGLGHRLDAIEASLASQVRQSQELMSDVARLAAVAARISQFDEVVNNHRQEFARLLEAAEERRTDKERQLDAMRRGDQEEVSKALAQLRVQIGALEETSRMLEGNRDEGFRVTRTLDALGKRVEVLAGADEDRERLLASWEDLRRQDGKRLNDYETQMAEFRVRIETLRGSLDAVEDRTRRSETRLADTSAGETERKQAQELWLEQQGLRIVGFEREWRDWGQRFEAFEKQVAEFDERVMAYEETYRGLNQLRLELEQTTEQVERRLTESAEIQRLGEERLKQGWSTFQAEDQKRWNTFRLATEEQWREHRRQHEKIESALEGIESRLDAVDHHTQDLLVSSEQRIVDLLATVRDWASRIEHRTGEPRR
jgi:chromosome segregation ATPase